MDVTINQEGNDYKVVLEGRVDTTNVEQFQNDMAPLMEAEVPVIDMDCKKMDYTSSQGLRVFLQLQKNVNARGGRMVLRNMQPRVKEVFDITGFSNIIKIV